MGFSDHQLAALLETDRGRGQPRAPRDAACDPVFKRVDTCGAEFESFTPYLYSTYEDEDEADTTQTARKS